MVKMHVVLFIFSDYRRMCKKGFAGSIADLASAAILIPFVTRLLNKEINNAS